MEDWRSGNEPDGASELDVKAARRSMQRLREIFQEIASNADDAMRNRCPYKDAKSRCTAKFGCRNQYFTRNPLEAPACKAADGLDYRSAWEIGTP